MYFLIYLLIKSPSQNLVTLTHWFPIINMLSIHNVFIMLHTYFEILNMFSVLITMKELNYNPVLQVMEGVVSL